jgi:hypothetical protein
MPTDGYFRIAGDPNSGHSHRGLTNLADRYPASHVLRNQNVRALPGTMMLRTIPRMDLHGRPLTIAEREVLRQRLQLLAPAPDTSSCSSAAESSSFSPVSEGEEHQTAAHQEARRLALVRYAASMVRHVRELFLRDRRRANAQAIAEWECLRRRQRRALELFTAEELRDEIRRRVSEGR